MVENYRGERPPKPKAVDQNITVCDHMATNLTTFTVDQTIEDAVNTLTSAGFSGAPVVNERCELIGIISEGDCLKAIVNEKYYNLPTSGLKVADCMVTNVIHIKPDLGLFEVAKMFLELRVRRFPVVDEDGKVIGQISQRDVMIAMNKLREQTWRENH